MIPRLVIHPQINKREEYLKKIIDDLGFVTNHPDLLYIKPEEKLGIEQARKIKNFLKLKPFKAEGQMIVIISAENLTVDAQNALLKTLEEHAEGVNLILGVKNEDVLLPTLISRCQIINLQQCSTPDVEYKYQKDIEKLINSTTEQRFQFIEKLKDREEFLSALIFYSRHKLLEKSLGDIRVPPLGWIYFLKELLKTEKWVSQNVNIRAILEYLMLKIPQK